jgi:hypothetical protein
MLRYNSTTGYMEAYTVSGWGSIATPPTIQTISPTSVAFVSVTTQVFTVTGAFFDAQTTIQLQGSDSTKYDTTTFTFTNSGSIGFKIGTLATGQLANRPFQVVVTNGAGLSATSTATISLLPPTITGLSNNTLLASATGSTTITVTGTGFTSSMASGNDVQVLGVDGSTLYNVDSVVIVDATSLTFKLSATGVALTSGQLTNRPYKVKLTGGAGLTATSTATIGFTGISWTTQTLNSYFIGIFSSQNLVATDEVGGNNVTFSIYSGSVSGLNLGSTGASPAPYAGTSSASPGAVNVTFRVTDNVTGATLDRTFAILSTDTLYSFTSHTFTRAAGDVRLGPTFAQMKTAYASEIWEQNTAWFNEVSGKQGFQLWTVPKTGTYRITAKGGQGARTAGNGTHSNSPGNGAYIRADIAFTLGTKIVIIVGQAGEFPTSSQKSNTGGGGGGATWILKESFTTASNQVYMVAGGGGGAGSPHYSVGQAGHAIGSSQGVLGGGGAAGGSYGSAGGAGWTGNGFAGGNGPGIRPAGGAMGGDHGYTGNGYESEGGFGGGGGNGADHSGGGAGATGGDGPSTNDNTSFGGTSYIITTAANRTFAGNHSSYEGSVYIQAPGTF